MAVAEIILSKLLLESKYKNAPTEDEKEEIVYKEISDELTVGYVEAKTAVEKLRRENATLGKEKSGALQQLQTRMEQFSKDLSHLQQEKKTAEDKRAIEAESRKKAEDEKADLQTELAEARRHISAERDGYANKKWTKWRNGHLRMFWGGLLGTVAVLVLTCYCVYGNPLNLP